MRTMFPFLLLIVGSASLHAEQDVQLLAPDKPAAAWTFDNGREFPGAKGTLAVDPEVKHDGRESLRLIGDFNGGGNYVQMGRDVSALKLELSALSFWLRAPGMKRITMRLIDGGGQCHQIDVGLEPPSDEWRLISFPVERFFSTRGTAEAVKSVVRYENWGGAKDGKWHGILKAMYLLVGKLENETKTTTIWVSGVTASVRAAAFSCDFEGANTLPANWTAQGDVSIDSKDAFQGANALLLNRSKEDVEKPCTATGPAFSIAPGAWEATCAMKSELTSPDSSYNGTVCVNVLDANGKQLQEVIVGEMFGKHAWQLAKKHFDVPSQAASAHFSVKLNKSDGRFWTDALAATAAAGHRASAVNRIVFASPQLGNMFHPDDPRTFTVTVESTRELSDPERNLAWVVRDYWGAEQGPVANVSVTAKGKNKERFRYEGQVDLAAQTLEVGRYYEIHAEVPLTDNKPFHNSAGFAILPEAVTKKYKAEQIPFTSRNWDNRIGEYLKLTDRLGIRIAGIWGGWAAEPPYKPHAPGVEICNQTGMGMLTGTPGGTIEGHGGGWQKYDEKALREGMRNFVTEFGKTRPLVIDQGNEPHNTGERLLESVRAYKIIYDEVKKIDPTITVVATSIGATDEYFKAGYQDACDVFDFHVYEDPNNVRQAIKDFQTMMAKYNCVKPI